MTEFFLIVGQCTIGAVIATVIMCVIGYIKISVDFSQRKDGQR